jgi:hypothetical protein
MSLSALQLGLYLGKGFPTRAPQSIVNAVQQVSVEHAEQAGSQGFSITFRAEHGSLAAQEYALLTEFLLKPGSRVVITLTLNATPQVLMDGIISQIQLSPSQGNQAGTITVTGKDVGMLLDLVDLNIPVPIPSVTGAVAFVLAKYAALGLIPEIIPPMKEVIYAPTERLRFQDGTDLEYLTSLASENGYIFSIKPGPTPGVSRAYWGPLVKIGLPQKALSVNMGHRTNVESVSFDYDALKPVQAYGLIGDPEAPVPIPLLSLTSMNPPPLASQSPFLVNQPYLKKERVKYEGTDPIEAYVQTQSKVDQSTESVVSVSGTLNALKYGDILRAPGIVGLRGAGIAHDGLYYVKTVSHTISKNQYQQSFTLGREGLGTIVSQVRV